MDWVSPREDAADALLNDLSSRVAPPPPAAAAAPAVSAAPPAPDFSPLVNGLLGSGSSPAVPGEWPIPHVTRNTRNDFRYEFSLSAGPEFDTESAGRDDARDAREDDTLSTDFHQGTSTSEDTSLGVDVSVGAHGQKGDPFADRDDMSALRSSPALSPASADAAAARLDPDDNALVKKLSNGLAPVHRPPKEQPELSNSRSASNSKPLPAQKPAKPITKKKSASAIAKPAAKASSTGPTSGPQTVSAGTSAIQSGTLSHTKMCRDRLNNMFERLRHTLPPAPTGVEVKHKAQVLDYAIAVLKGMVDRTSQLEIELAVSSNKATMDWISKLVARVDTFPEAAEEVMRLFCRRRGWMHSELWTAGKRPVPDDTEPEDSTLLNFCIAVPNDAQSLEASGLEQFSKESESYVFRPKEGVQGRVWSSMRPEWVTGLSDSKNFRRSSLARKFGLKVCLAVPVTITGKIEAIMCFYDVKHRPYDTQCLELAMRLAWALGNAVGGKRAKVSVLTASGTSNT